MTAFVRKHPGTYDEALDRFVGASTTTIIGSAIQVSGDPQRYAALGLVLSTSPTLFFTPTAYNLRAFTPDFVVPGDIVTWNDTDFTVKDVKPIAPDGIVVAARIIAGAP